MMEPGRRGESAHLRRATGHGVIVLALLVGGCAPTPSTAGPSRTSSAASPSLLPEPTVSPDPAPSRPSATPEPSRAPTPSSAGSSTTFTSPLYRYRLTLPEEVGAGAWVPAIRAWDGRQTLVRAGPFLDRTLLPEGGLFLLGTPTSNDVDAFAAEIASLYETNNQCAAPTEIREVAIDGIAARAFTQNCPEGLRPARVVLVNDGYGILAFMTANPDHQADALDLVIALLDGLEWLPPG